MGENPRRIIKKGKKEDGTCPWTRLDVREGQCDLKSILIDALIRGEER